MTINLLSRLRAHKAVRLGGRAASLAIAILAAALVASLTIDLGPSVRESAERLLSGQVRRPVHLGRLSLHVLAGRVVVDDFSIEGLTPDDRPFFTARRLTLALDWLTLVKRRPEISIASVEMTDWQMLVEKWEGGRNNFPHLVDNAPRQKPRPFVTTVRYLRAWRGQFTYEDHEEPWSIVAPALDLNLTNLPQYHGTAVFKDGTIQIRDYRPMWANFKARFVLDGPRVHLERIDVKSDGAETVASGDVDFSRWPEQQYAVKSRVQFPRMKAIFFTDEPWSLSGDGDFTGTFHLFDGGHDLKGTFSSRTAGLNAYRFPGLYGSLRWTDKGFDVWNAGAKFYGGDARFAYSIKRLGESPSRTARLEATVARTDLTAYTDFIALRGARFGGSADGHVFLEWPLGRFRERTGHGHLVVAPPPGTALMMASLEAAREADASHSRHEWGPFAPVPLAPHLPIGGGLTFRLDADHWEVDDGLFATERTHVAFRGAADWEPRGRFAFHVTSRDWQESDQVLAGILTDFGSPTGPVPFAGRGEFDGTMTGPFRRPRVEGTFGGEDLWAWDTLWGEGAAHIVAENDYLTVQGGIVRLDGSEIHTDGLFSLGSRDDGGDEIDARFRVTRRDLAGLRHAFQIDEYPLSGALSGEFHLTGEYRRPTGFGGMTIDEGAAYGQPMRKATASLRFDEDGIRVDGIDIDIDKSGSGAAIMGAAFIGWDSTYSFNASGRGIPVSRLATSRSLRVSVSGLGEFSATGSGTFDVPRNDFKFRVDDVVIGDEPVGLVTGSLALRGRELSGEVDAASPRLALTGTGRIALTPQADCELSFRFHDSSLDPYVRLFQPSLSPYTTAVASGSVRIVGELADVDHLVVETTVDALDMRLFDYALKNAAPIRIALDRRTIEVEDLQLVGEDTRLRVLGRVGLGEGRIALQVAGDANLGILQGFFRDVRGSGRAELQASVDGPLKEPLFSGSATVTNGRIRYLALPNSLDSINGTIEFDARGLTLDGVTAMMGGGPVQFGGRIGFEGYLPGELNVVITGQDMRVRYPEGIQSVVDADLSLRGNVRAPTLGGTVTVKSAVWTRRIDTPGSIFDFASRSAGGEALAPAPAQPVPLRLDLEISVPSTLRVETSLVRLTASADLTLRGMYDKPVLLGHADVDSGTVTFEGQRYRVTRGSVDFTNPTQAEPFFDIEAETNVRGQGQNYRVTVSAAGPSDRLTPKLESDPPLPPADILALLLGGFQAAPTAQAPELRALANPNQAPTDVLTTRATQALTNPLSSEVGKVFEQTIGVDTFQLTPSFTDPTGQTSRLNPTARITFGKRISDRAYLTFSRSLNTTFNDQVIQLQYDASDRLSWLLSRNEDQQTYSIEFRVRHAF